MAKKYPVSHLIRPRGGRDESGAQCEQLHQVADFLEARGDEEFLHPEASPAEIVTAVNRKLPEEQRSRYASSLREYRRQRT